MSTATPVQRRRTQLDQIFLVDASISVLFGLIALLTPHGIFERLLRQWDHGTPYSAAAHEALRLYGCLRIAVGWILFHVRHVDDGKFRRAVCEALSICYVLQVLAVLRSMATSPKVSILNLVAVVFLSLLGMAYLQFRWSLGSSAPYIKVFELPSTRMDQ